MGIFTMKEDEAREVMVPKPAFQLKDGCYECGCHFTKHPPEQCSNCKAQKQKTMANEEQVNHPLHYGGNTVYETIKVLEAKLTFEQFVGFCRGSAIKYLTRAEKKGSSFGEVQRDLEKARFYVDYEIDFRARYLRGEYGEGRVQMLEGPDGKA